MGLSASSEGAGAPLLPGEGPQEFPEPQTFLEKSVYGSFILSVLWTSHIRFPLNGIVIPVYSSNEEIRVMNHFMMRGVSLDMIEDLLEKSSLYKLLNVGEFKCKEYTMEKERKSPVTVLFVKYPRYTGKNQEIETLKQSFGALLEEAKKRQLFRFVIPIVQSATIMTFPKAIFCAALVEVALKKMKEWTQMSLVGNDQAAHDSSFKMKLILLASENSGCRLMCKHLVEQCKKVAVEEGEEDEDEKKEDDPITKLSQISSIEVLENEIKELDVNAIKQVKVTAVREKKDSKSAKQLIQANDAPLFDSQVNPQNA